jgi:hypothetical protein
MVYTIISFHKFRMNLPFITGCSFEGNVWKNDTVPDLSFVEIRFHLVLVAPNPIGNAQGHARWEQNDQQKNKKVPHRECLEFSAKVCMRVANLHELNYQIGKRFQNINET